MANMLVFAPWPLWLHCLHRTGDLPHLFAIVGGAEAVRGGEDPAPVEDAASAQPWGQSLPGADQQLLASLTLLAQRPDLEVGHPRTVLRLVTGNDADSVVFE